MFFFFSSRRRHTRFDCDWSSDVCSSDLSDVVLTHKIESEVFRDRDIPKGDINVNCVDGVAFLRGQVERPDLVELIEARSEERRVGKECRSRWWAYHLVRSESGGGRVRGD